MSVAALPLSDEALPSAPEPRSGHDANARDSDVRNLSGHSTAELLELVSVGLQELTDRLVDPEALRGFAVFREVRSGPSAQDWGTGWSADGAADGVDTDETPADDPFAEKTVPTRIPAYHCEDPEASLPQAVRTVESMARRVDALQIRLTGLVADTFNHEADRPEFLGVPAGRVMYKHHTAYLRHLTHVGGKEIAQRLDTARRLYRNPAAGALLVAHAVENSAKGAGDPGVTTERGAAADGAGMGTADAAQGARDDVSNPRDFLLSTAAQAFHRGEVTERALRSVITSMAGAADTAEKVSYDRGKANSLLKQGEALLTGSARDLDDDNFFQAAARWRQLAENLINPDGELPEDEHREQKCRIRYRGRNRDGNHDWEMSLDDVSHELMETICQAANNPAGRTLEGETPFINDGAEAPEIPGGQTAAAETPEGDPVGDMDRRTWGQRALHAVLMVLHAGLRSPSNKLPDHGTTRPVVMVTMDYATMMRQAHAANLLPAGFDLSVIEPYRKPELFLSEGQYTGPIRPAHIRELLVEADLMPVVLGGAGQVLDVGTRKRFFDGHLRAAVAARDGGCAAPGCTAPISWCQTHHHQPVREGGATAVNNGVLLCRHDHALADRGDWQIEFIDDVPYFRAPIYHDPWQTPRRNTYWRSGANA